MSKVICKLGDDVSTDAIYPGRYMATVLPSETPQFAFADHTELGVNFSVIGLAWGGSFLMPLDGDFPATLNLATSDFDYFHLNYFLNVK